MLPCLNRINRHHNDIGLSTSIIMESATVASDKGPTTLGVGILKQTTVAHIIIA